jgi:hypothetical protein
MRAKTCGDHTRKFPLIFQHFSIYSPDPPRLLSRNGISSKRDKFPRGLLPTSTIKLLHQPLNTLFYSSRSPNHSHTNRTSITHLQHSQLYSNLSQPNKRSHTHISLKPSRVNRHSNNFRMFKVNFPRHEVNRRFTCPIRRGRKRHFILLADTPYQARQRSEDRLGRCLEEGSGSLEQQEGSNDVDLVVRKHPLCRCVESAAPVVCYAGICDDEIEVRDLEGGDGC